MKRYTGLWLLLAIALIIVTAFAFIDDVTLFGHTLRKAPLREALLGNAEREQRADSIALAEKERAEQAQRVDSTRQVFLLFGDSMTLNLAYRLDAYARQNGHEMHAVNWDSSSTVIWAESDTLNYYIEKYQPTQIFVSLGSNELYLKNTDSRRTHVQKIIDKMGDIPFIWIGPPNWQEDSGINDMLEELCGKDRYFRTDGMELARKKDKIHPTRDASALWLDSVMRWMPTSVHPFVAELPSDTLPKHYPDVVFLKAKHK